MGDVYQYDPTYDSRRYASTNSAIKAFATGPQGNAVRSFNVGIEHLGTAEELGQALENGNVQLLNAARRTRSRPFSATTPRQISTPQNSLSLMKSQRLSLADKLPSVTARAYRSSFQPRAARNSSRASLAHSSS